MPHFFRVTYAVVREGHNALSKGKAATAFRAFPRCLQVLGKNEVFRLQRVKHDDLRENRRVAARDRWSTYVPAFGGTKHSTRP